MIELAFRKKLRDYALDLNLDVPPGVTVLFGPSGAGKSMTLACVAGLESPDNGRISINGRLFFDKKQGINLPPQRRRVGYVMQDYLLFPHMTVTENIAFGLTRMSRQKKEATVTRALALVGLEGMEQQMPGELSGGQQQRVALARAVVIRPRALLLDEPFSALDGPTRARLRRDVLRIQRELDLPVLFVTHDLSEAYLLADWMAVMADGRLLQAGPPQQVIYKPVSEQVARLVGSSNFFSGKILQVDGSDIDLEVGNLCLQTTATAVPHSKQVTLSIRPERIFLVRKDRATMPRPNMVQGQIVEEMSDGFYYTLFFQLDEGQRLRADAAFDLEVVIPTYVYERLQVNQDRRWALSISPEAVHIFDGG